MIKKPDARKMGLSHFLAIILQSVARTARLAARGYFLLWEGPKQYAQRYDNQNPPTEIS
ncbi:MAG: hypothetical protein IH899_12685 [Planctomycetes bacterium]|nr:hypothetical protein [Planctomycetota bacterium]